MLFYICCTDKSGNPALRKANRDAHLAYIKDNYADKILVAGPTLEPDMQGMNGSVFIVDLPDPAAAQAMAENDPYAKAGLFESVVIRPFKKVFGA